MDELQAEGDGFDLRCKVLLVASVVVSLAGLALTMAAVYQPLHYVLFAVGFVGGTIALVTCLRETNLVGPDERADPDPQEDDPSPPPEVQDE